MATLNLTTSASGNNGLITYNWSFNQSSGTAVSGVSISNSASSVVLTYPNTLTYAGNNATTGSYSFIVQCIMTDTGINGCTSTRSITLWFNDTPLNCNLTSTPIVIY